MSGDEQIAVPPSVKWAQRQGIVYLTIFIEDCKNPVLKIESDSLFFSGLGGTPKRPYEVTINFYKEIKPEETKKNITGRVIELILKKKEEGPYWPQLCKEKKKYGYLSVDFGKWLDEDDDDIEDLEGTDDKFQNMMSMMGGMGVDGYTPPNLDDLDNSDTSDGELELPDLEEAAKDDDSELGDGASGAENSSVKEGAFSGERRKI